jgi:hypothetical protein
VGGRRLVDETAAGPGISAAGPDGRPPERDHKEPRDDKADVPDKLPLAGVDVVDAEDLVIDRPLD